MKIKRNMIVWAELKSGLRHIQAGRRPCIVISCDKANGKSPVYTVVPGTTKLKKDYIPVHFNIEPSEIRGFLRHTTMFLPEQLVTINEEQIIQTAGMIVSTDAIKKVDAMLVRQLQMENMMDDENELENQSIDIPIWKRYLLSVTEAAQFYHIGEKRLRQIVDIHPNGEFYLLVGNKVLFKKEKFEQFLAESTAI